MSKEPVSVVQLINLLQEKGTKITLSELWKILGLLHISVYLSVIGLFVSWTAIIFAYSNWVKPPGPDPGQSTIATVLGATAYGSYSSERKLSFLEGRWHATWYQTNMDGSEERLKIRDHDGLLVEYPDEYINFAVDKGCIYGNALNTQVNINYWLTGRLTNDDVINLIYWSQKGTTGENRSGTVFLRLERDIKQAQFLLTGQWIGGYPGGETKRGRVRMIRGQN